MILNFLQEKGSLSMEKTDYLCFSFEEGIFPPGSANTVATSGSRKPRRKI